MSKKLYEKNIDNFNNFFKTIEYKELKNKNDIEGIKNKINKGFLKNGEKIYNDPDTWDKELYDYIKEHSTYISEHYECKERKEKRGYYFEDKNKKEKINLSLDCVMGWKAIIDVCVKNSIPLEEFVKVYEIIRKYEYSGHLVWPIHNLPTINSERYQQFRDRVDYTLYDIKKFYDIPTNLRKDIEDEINKLKLRNVYLTPSYTWLNTFEDFNDFIENMKLECWCKKINNNYEVKDLSTKEKKPISGNLENMLKKDLITIEYINNVIDIISDGKEEYHLEKK